VSNGRFGRYLLASTCEFHYCLSNNGQWKVEGELGLAELLGSFISQAPFLPTDGVHACVARVCAFVLVIMALNLNVIQYI
jgi:hypothetical protein